MDENQNVYTTGTFQSTVDFNPQSGVASLVNGGFPDTFVLKLDTNGAFGWVHQIGGTGEISAADIDVDAEQSAYVTGRFTGTADFDPGGPGYERTSAGESDIFVAKLEGSGNLRWAECMGGTSTEQGRAITVDSSTNVYTTGDFFGTADFDPDSGTTELTSAGGADVFLSQLVVPAPVDNRAPVLPTIADQTIDETNGLTFTVTASDPDAPGQTVTYSLDPGAPAGAAINSSTGLFAWAPGESVGPFSDQVTVRATDSGSPAFSDTATFTITVREVNERPTMEVIADKTVSRGQTLAFQAAATDADVPANELTFSLDSGAHGDATIHPDTGDFCWTVDPLQVLEDYTIRVRVTDNGAPALSDEEDFIVSVVNNPPTISDIPDQLTDEDTTTGEIALTIEDIETPASLLTLSASSSNASLVPSENILFGGSGTARTVTVTPAEDQSGTATITVVVTDADGAAEWDSFVLTVNAKNDPPTISSIADRTIIEDIPSDAYGFTVGDVETDAGSLVVAASSSNTTLVPNENIVFGGSGANRTVTVTPAANQSGTAAITLTVTDADGGKASGTFELTVTPANDAPNDLGLSGTSVAENEPTGTVLGSFSTTDPDTGDTFTYSLVVGSGDADNDSFTIAGDQLKIAASFDFESKSSCSIRVRSTDAGGLWTEEAFPITVTDVNEAPTDLTVSPAVIAENTDTTGAHVEVGTLSATDEDVGNTYTYWLVAGEGDTDNASFVIVDDKLKVKQGTVLDHEAKDTYSLRVKVNDGANDLEKALVISVTDVNDAPAGTDGAVTTREGTAYPFAEADFGFTDPNDSPPDGLGRVQITTLPGAGTLKLDGTPVGAGQFVTLEDVHADKLTFDPAADATGSPYTTFTFQVEDDGGTADGGENLDPSANTMTVHVTSVNDAPTIGSLADDPDPLERGDDLTLTADAVEDPDGDVASVTFWRDANQSETLDDADEELGTDTDPAGGWSVVVSTASFPLGEATYFAQATDSGGRTSNVVSANGRVNRTVDLFGTDGPDTITFTTGISHIVWINENEYVYDPSLVSAINIHAGDGEDAITITGGAEDETAELRVGSVDVVGATYEVHAESVERIVVHAGQSTGDEAYLYDRDATKDTFVGTPEYGRIYGDGFDHRVVGFRRVTAMSSGAGDLGTLALDADVAELRDSSGADLLEATPDDAKLTFGGLEDNFVQAIGFREVHAFGSDDGQTDTAVLEDEPGQRDRFRAWPTEAKMFGLGFYNRAKGFDDVQASGSDSTDVAQLYDSSGADVVEAYADRTTMTRSDRTVVRADDFRWLFAFASDDGETDTARLYDTTADLGTSYATWFKGFNHLSKMYGPTFYNRVDDFDEVIASAVGSDDATKLFDSSGPNALEAYADQATMSYPDGTTVQADDFRWVLAYGSADGQVDTAQFYDTTADLGTSYATWFKADDDIARLYHEPVFYVQVRDFDGVSATAVDSNDSAKLFDSALDDIYWSRPNHSRMEYADGTYAEALDFRNVRSYSDYGSDTATFYDETAGGTSYAARFVANADWAKLFHGAFFSRTEGFAEVRAATSDDDLVWLEADSTRVDHLLVTFPGDAGHAAAKAKRWTDQRAIYLDDFHTLTATTSEDFVDEKDVDSEYVDDVILEGNWADAT